MLKLTEIAILLISLLFLLFLGLSRPLYNWDMIGYVAAAHQRDGLAGDALSAAAYNSVQAAAGEAFPDLIAGEYRAAVYQDPASLEQQIPLYSVRVAYVELMRALHGLGVSYPQATIYLSAFFAAASLLVLAGLCQHLHVSVLWVPLVAAFAGFGALARFATPDAMACCVALLCLYLLVRAHRLAYVVAALLPLIRTDFILCSLLVLVCLAWRDQSVRSKIYAAASALAALGLYIAVTHISGHYGYLSVFHFTFMEFHPYPRDMALSDDWRDYLRPYLSMLNSLYCHPHSLVYILGIAYTLACARMRSTQAQAESLQLLVIALGFVAAHLALFPLFMTRFFAFPVSVILLVLLSARQSSKR
jgi:hypothetical protein